MNNKRRLSDDKISLALQHHILSLHHNSIPTSETLANLHSIPNIDQNLCPLGNASGKMRKGKRNYFCSI